MDGCGCGYGCVCVWGGGGYLNACSNLLYIPMCVCVCGLYEWGGGVWVGATSGNLDL